MKICFSKFHGTGNDFILIDDRLKKFGTDPTKIRFLCDRHMGIGADGLLLLQNEPGYDFRMVYFNNDGIEATFCGNGSRCITAFAQMMGIPGNQYKFIAADGAHTASIISENGYRFLIRVSMINPVIYWVTQDEVYLNTGTYHVVKMVDDPDRIYLEQDAPKIRYHVKYQPHGTNVNYVHTAGNSLFLRTYEKGVEAETLSCGTGVTASAIAASLRYGGDSFRIITKGGELNVSFLRTADSFENVTLQGPAVHVFSSEIEYDA